MFEDEDWEFAQIKPRWECQECTYTDEITPLPPDKEKWYKKQKAKKCPACRSESLIPVGW